MQYVLGGVQRELDVEMVKRAACQNVPDLIDGRHKYYVTVEGNRYPIKQLFGLASGLHLSEFITDDAYRLLKKLGFTIERFGHPSSTAVQNKNAESPAIQDVEEAGKLVNFAVSLEPDDDGYIVASCPQLPGCHSQGTSRQEALKNIEEAIRGYVASLRYHGEDIPSGEWDIVRVRV